MIEQALSIQSIEIMHGLVFTDFFFFVVERARMAKIIIDFSGILDWKYFFQIIQIASLFSYEQIEDSHA